MDRHKEAAPSELAVASDMRRVGSETTPCNALALELSVLVRERIGHAAPRRLVAGLLAVVGETWSYVLCSGGLVPRRQDSLGLVVVGAAC